MANRFGMDDELELLFTMEAGGTLESVDEDPEETYPDGPPGVEGLDFLLWLNQGLDEQMKAKEKE